MNSEQPWWPVGVILWLIADMRYVFRNVQNIESHQFLLNPQISVKILPREMKFLYQKGKLLIIDITYSSGDEWLVPLLVAEGIPKNEANNYQKIFNQNRITKDQVVKLTYAVLKDMGIPVGDVLRMEDAFKKMKIEK